MTTTVTTVTPLIVLPQASERTNDMRVRIKKIAFAVGCLATAIALNVLAIRYTFQDIDDARDAYQSRNKSLPEENTCHASTSI